MIDPRAFLLDLFQAAVAAADPRVVLAQHLPPPAAGRTVVVGAGKAAASMAAAVEAAWPSADLSGLVVTRYAHGLPTRRIEVVEAGHPVPDEAGERAARRILDLVSGLTERDRVLCLISGGGSALLALPTPGFDMAAKRRLTGALLKSGADITEMNKVRKHLSAIKGGRLAAAAHPAEILTLAISDVPGDDPSVIASGPTVPDPSTIADARAVLAKYGIEAPDVMTESPKPGDPRLARARTVLISRPLEALQAAAAKARAAGVEPLVLGDAIEGEAREVGRAFAGIARSVLVHGMPVARPAVILSGGETTVTVRGGGRGGRNAEFLLGCGLALGALPAWGIACDTDGIDGSEDNAGAIWTPDSLARGPDGAHRLADNDAYSFFAALGDLVVTGPTRTNVNDFRALYLP